MVLIPFDSRIDVLTSEERMREPLHRASAPGRPGGGVDGNERLTAGTAVVLVVLLAALGVTILSIGPLIWWHVVDFFTGHQHGGEG